MMAELAIAATNWGVIHVTYVASNADKPREDWPHRKYPRLMVVLCKHHGRYVALWFTWQVCSLLPQRRVEVRREDD